MNKQIWSKETIAKIQMLVVSALTRTFGYRADIDDMKQEAFLRIVMNKDKLPDGGICCAYIKVMARNAAFDLLRKQKGEPPINDMWSLEEADLDEQHMFHIATPSYVPIYSDPFLVREAERVVAEMTPRHREVIQLKAEGFNYGQIAKELNISVGTVRSRLHYAKKQGMTKLESFMN